LNLAEECLQDQMKTNTDGASLWKAGWGVLYRDHLCVVQARDGFKGGKSHWKVKESPIGRHNITIEYHDIGFPTAITTCQAFSIGPDGAIRFECPELVTLSISACPQNNEIPIIVLAIFHIYALPIPSDDICGRLTIRTLLINNWNWHSYCLGVTFRDLVQHYLEPALLDSWNLLHFLLGQLRLTHFELESPYERLQTHLTIGSAGIDPTIYSRGLWPCCLRNLADYEYNLCWGKPEVILLSECHLNSIKLDEEYCQKDNPPHRHSLCRLSQ
nr:hypothetical protein [Tanacetum cinerariifolium]